MAGSGDGEHGESGGESVNESVSLEGVEIPGQDSPQLDSALVEAMAVPIKSESTRARELFRREYVLAVRIRVIEISADDVNILLRSARHP
jgi:hypothetical protein